MRILIIMKARVNLTIEQDILDRAKKYASDLGSSVSELVENYLKNVSTKVNSESLIDYVDKLEIPDLDKNINYKRQYYEDTGQKYGF